MHYQENLKDIVFISYAREDSTMAERLYMDLRRNEINAWIDSKCLLPGENWQKTVSNTIKNASFFLLLISKYSVSKRGYVQREIKQALRVLEEFPTDQIFLIPVKLDETEPVDAELQGLNWVDIGNSYNKGIRRILTVLSQVEREPLKYIDPKRPTEKRAPIEYKPYQSTDDFFRQLIEKLPVSTIVADLEFSYYITFITSDTSKIQIPEYLKKKFPKQMTIVLQYQYDDLKVWENSFSVKLKFSGVEESLSITFSEILNIEMPQLGISIDNKRAINSIT